MTSLETPRLRLRPLRQDDEETLLSWCSDPTVMKYYPGGGWTRDEGRRRVASYMAHQDAYGFAKWLMLDRETGEPVGDSGLMHLSDSGHRWLDLGYRLKATHWGRGLASEAARAWIEIAPSLDLEEIGAFAHVDNHGSLNVLRKVGFVEIRRDTLFTVPAIVFSMKVGDS